MKLIHLIFPRIKHLHVVLVYLFIGGILGGLYGAVHDQISYSISPEYFTHFKFAQFYYADWGWPNRAFVAVIGAIAVGTVGMIGGWLLTRIRFYSDNMAHAHKDIFIALFITLGIAALAGIIGLIAGYVRVLYFPFTEFIGFENQMTHTQLQKFAMVGYLHNAGYIGGLAGVIIAAIYLRKRRT